VFNADALTVDPVDYLHPVIGHKRPNTCFADHFNANTLTLWTYKFDTERISHPSWMRSEIAEVSPAGSA
jgi:hypothetical protein